VPPPLDVATSALATSTHKCRFIPLSRELAALARASIDLGPST